MTTAPEQARLAVIKDYRSAFQLPFGCSNTEKRVENTTRSGVFSTNFEGFDIVMKHCDECLI